MNDKDDGWKRDPHEFCEKEIESLRAIVKELKKGYAKTYNKEYVIPKKLRLILMRCEWKAEQLEKDYWKDKPAKARKRRKPQLAQLAWAGLRREEKNI